MKPRLPASEEASLPDPAQLEPDSIRTALQARYGLAVTALDFLPLGNDAASFVYRVAARGQDSFLKLRAASGFQAASLTVPHFLAQQGIPHILAPLPSLEGALWVDVEGFAMSLYPFLTARTAKDAGLSEEQWQALGGMLRRVHASSLPPQLQRLIPQESFVPSRRQVPQELESRLALEPADPLQRDLRRLWRAHQDEINLLIHRADSLGSQLRQRRLPNVLCHADLHTWNVLLDHRQEMWVVDWDEVVMAPKERDLMFVIGGICRGLVNAQETDAFLRGYGDSRVGGLALSYYRYAWAVQDMAAYAEEVFFSPRFSEQARLEALRGFTSLFAPGNIVEIALKSDLSQL